MKSSITLLGSMIAEPARANMLLALLSGKALTASELALEANITAQTASSHLGKLLDAGMIKVEKQGRHKYFQLQNEDIAQLLESLLVLTNRPASSTIKTGPTCPSLRKARVCYDHLAGKLAVDLFDHFQQQSLIDVNSDAALLTEKGQEFFSQLGADILSMRNKRRPVCRACLDWSERRHHLAGALGQWVLNLILENKWAKRDMDSRAIHFTEYGYKQMMKTLMAKDA